MRHQTNSILGDEGADLLRRVINVRQALIEQKPDFDQPGTNLERFGLHRIFNLDHMTVMSNIRLIRTFDTGQANAHKQSNSSAKAVRENKNSKPTFVLPRLFYFIALAVLVKS